MTAPDPCRPQLVCVAPRLWAEIIMVFAVVSRDAAHRGSAGQGGAGSAGRKKRRSRTESAAASVVSQDRSRSRLGLVAWAPTTTLSEYGSGSVWSCTWGDSES